jgi:hypothetical protein
MFRAAVLDRLLATVAVPALGSLARRSFLVWYVLLGICTTACNLCSESASARAQSPSGELYAVVVQRDCGATTELVEHVVILPPGKEPRFVDAKTALSVAGKSTVAVAWSGDRELRITWQGGRVVRFRSEVEGVRITCDPPVSAK